MSFTAGPWKAKPSCAGPTWGWYVEGPPEADYHDSQFEKEDDARLIAAAPDLLAALQDMEPFLDAIVCYASSVSEHEPNRLVANAKAAISKATKGAGS